MEAAVVGAGGAGLTRWQAAALSAVAGWVWAASFYDLTRRARALVQSWVTRRVHAETPAILRFQRFQHNFLDNFFSVLSCVVSVPFYTGFVPLLFWSGHNKLARQMTLLMALCDYLGNFVKDMISAPCPCSPPVRRVTATEDEKENAIDPSSVDEPGVRQGHAPQSCPRRETRCGSCHGIFEGSASSWKFCFAGT